MLAWFHVTRIALQSLHQVLPRNQASFDSTIQYLLRLTFTYDHLVCHVCSSLCMQRRCIMASRYIAHASGAQTIAA